MTGGVLVMFIVGMVVFGVALFFFIAIVVPKFIFAKMEGPLMARVAEHYRPDEIVMQDLRANTFGLESAGVWQGRGNGALVLTGKNVHWFRFVKGADLAIPLEAITDVSFTKSHLGKRTIYDLLKVSFSNNGKPDSMAWYLPDPHAWKARIEELRAGSRAVNG